MQARKTAIDNDTLNKCTQELLTCLPEHAAQLIGELSEDYHLPMWQVFCGVVLEVHMQGNLSNFYMDPAWAEGLKYYTYHCEHCGKEFDPVNLGQVFCSNKCGEAHNTKGSKHVEPVNAVSGANSDVVVSTDNFVKRFADIVSKKEETSGWIKDAELSI